MENVLFILLLIAAAVIIVSFTHISLHILSATKWKRQADIYQRHEKTASDDDEGQAAGNNGGSAPFDCTALIHTIKAEGRRNRAEEQREDDAGKLRDWLTILLIAVTVIAVGWQVGEMVKVYGPIKDQAEAAKASAAAATAQSISSANALIQAQRAWIGPRIASITTELAIGKPVDIIFTYENSGHEPGVDFHSYAEAVRTTVAGDPVASQTIQQDLSACRDSTDWKGGSVVFPSSGGFGGECLQLLD